MSLDRIPCDRCARLVFTSSSVADFMAPAVCRVVVTHLGQALADFSACVRCARLTGYQLVTHPDEEWKVSPLKRLEVAVFPWMDIGRALPAE